MASPLRLPALETFNGKSEDYESFSRRLKAYFISINQKYKNFFRYAESAADEIEDDVFMDDDELKMSRELHYVLVQLCRGTSETLLLQGDSENGLENWRVLHGYYKRPSLNTSMGRLSQILDYDFKNLDEDFMHWEAEIHKFETETSSLLPSMVKTAVLMNKIEGPLQQHLQLNASHSTDFRQVREMVLNFSKAKTSFKNNPINSSTSSSTSSPMEVDAINKGKGKGKGKDKQGKGKKGKKGGQRRSKGGK